MNSFNPTYRMSANSIGLKAHLNVDIYHTSVFLSAFWMVYPVISVLPLSFGRVHSRAALKPHTSTSFTLAGGPGNSEGKHYRVYARLKS